MASSDTKPLKFTSDSKASNFQMTAKSAINLLLSLTIAVTLFHLSILLKLVPYDIAWGGRLTSDNQMYVFETISILVNGFFGLILLMKGAYIKAFVPVKMLNAMLWFFLILFLMNTIGNIFAKTDFEKIFAVITLAFSILIVIILRSKDKKAEKA